jgi:hypothetical protein
MVSTQQQREYLKLCLKSHQLLQTLFWRLARRRCLSHLRPLASPRVRAGCYFLGSAGGTLPSATWQALTTTQAAARLLIAFHCSTAGSCNDYCPQAPLCSSAAAASLTPATAARSCFVQAACRKYLLRFIHLRKARDGPLGQTS